MDVIKVKELIDNFIKDYKEHAESSEMKSGFNYNVLAEQCGNIVENSHTNLLMRLLEYRNKYGYVFLNDFISMAGFDIILNDVDVKFKKEYSTENESGKKGRIDGFIFQEGNFAIIIENKINHAGNQDEQILRYIESVLKKQIVDKDQIYVVFLTRDGVESPDKESLDSMMEYGICNLMEDGMITGPRYFPCSYSQHVLNWLKDDIQPIVPQKDVVLNAGLIQYIDYLEGILGCGKNVLKSENEYKKWFDDHISLSGSIIEDNSYLYKLYNCLFDQKDDDDVVKSEAINILKNLIEVKNDELMEPFLIATKDFFTKGEEPLMANYHLNHHFTYYYITIRDKDWPRGIDFGWYPLGLKKLCKENELTFYFKAKGERLEAEKEQLLDKLGFVFHEKSRTFHKSILVSRGEHDNGTFLSLNEKMQRQFLKSVYREYAEPIVRSIIPML